MALYTFLSNNPKFREFSAKFWTTVMLQLIATVACSFAFILEMLKAYCIGERHAFRMVLDRTETIFICLFSVMFAAGWLYLCKVFYVIFGSLYHLRKKRFLKYTKLFGWFYEKFIHKSFYEKNYRERTDFKVDSFPNLDLSHLKKVQFGGTILFLYHDNVEYEELVVNYILESIKDGETVDYVTTYKSPVDLCACFTDGQVNDSVKRLSIIDCFTPRYSFDDKIVKFTMEKFKNKGFKFYMAESFAEIHTAANDSWHRFRKVCRTEENMYRLPHRTVYDTLSSLIRYSSEELYFLFLRHVISSEKSYGMISLVIEPVSLKAELKNDLIRMADIVIRCDESGMTVMK